MSTLKTSDGVDSSGNHPDSNQKDGERNDI